MVYIIPCEIYMYTYMLLLVYSIMIKVLISHNYIAIMDVL